jgi:tricorn protease-like protein
MRFHIAAILTLSAAACASGPAPSAAPAAPAPYARAEALALPDRNGLVFAPEDRALLVASDETEGVFNLYAQPLGDGERATLTNSLTDSLPLSYFPADERVLMRIAGGRLGVRLTDGAIRELTRGGENDARFLGWRADQAAFFAAISSNATPQVRTVYAFDASSYERTPLYQTAARVEAISRDGRWLAITHHANIEVIDLQAPQAPPRLVPRHRSPTAPTVYEFAPDGRSLIYARNEGDGFVQAWRYDLASGEHTPVMEAQANVLAVTSSPSGRYRVFEIGPDQTPVDVMVVDQQTDRVLPLSDGVRDVRFSRDETTIAYRLHNDAWPQDIFVSDLDGENIQRIAHAPRARR